MGAAIFFSCTNILGVFTELYRKAPRSRDCFYLSLSLLPFSIIQLVHVFFFIPMGNNPFKLGENNISRGETTEYRWHSAPKKSRYHNLVTAYFSGRTPKKGLKILHPSYALNTNISYFLSVVLSFQSMPQTLTELAILMSDAFKQKRIGITCFQ